MANARLDVATRTASVAGDWTAAWRDHPFELMLIGTAVRIAAFAGRIDEAAGLLDQASSTYSDLGATRWLAELEPVGQKPR